MNTVVQVKDKKFALYIPEEKILARVKEVAAKMDEDLRKKNPLFLVVLNGSFVFAADLLRNINFPCEITFVRVSSYEGDQSTGEVKQQLGIDFDIEGRDIIIVEDIVETGHSMTYLLDYLKAKNPASITICTLFFKPEKFLYEYKIDYTALSIGNEFIVGYGLDYNQLGRNLKDIYVIDE